MKKKKVRILAVLMAALMLLIAGCGGSDEDEKEQNQTENNTQTEDKNESGEGVIQDGDLLLMVNGGLYYATGEESEAPEEGSEPDGTVESSVREGGIPQEDGQSNFGYGNEYYIVDDETLSVMYDGLWMVFKLGE